MIPMRRKIFLNSIVSISLFIAAGLFGAQIKLINIELNVNLPFTPELSKKISPEKSTERQAQPKSVIEEPSTVIYPKIMSQPSSVQIRLSELLALSTKQLDNLRKQNPQFIPQQIDIIDLLKINQQRFSQNFYYIAHIPNYDAKQTRYILSSSHDEKHLLAYFLRNTITPTLEYRFEISECNQQRCNSQKQGNSFASFTFDKLPSFQERTLISAKCDYENIYRREYENDAEMEIAFKNCN